MFNSTILDVVIGLVFCYASIALLVSAINEGISSLLKTRQSTLRAGIQRLLNPHDDLLRQLYGHSLVNPLGVKPDARSLPAYIPSRDFAAALVDVIGKIPADMDAFSKELQGLRDSPLKSLLQGFVARSEKDLDLLRKQVADWFDNAMDRLSGNYKRHAQLVTFIIGLVTAVAFNIDSFYVLGKLWERPSLSSAISGPLVNAMAKDPSIAKLLDTHVENKSSAASGLKVQDTSEAAAESGTASATTTAVAESAVASATSAANKASGAAEHGTSTPAPKGAPSASAVGMPTDSESASTVSGWMKTLDQLPVGWDQSARAFPLKEPDGKTDSHWSAYLFLVMGWIVTATSAVFGAPFWFDLLQRLVQIRGTGGKPDKASPPANPASG